jgi:DNA-binding response OmpR family regulator
MQTTSEMNRQPEKSAAAITPHILLAEDDNEMHALLAHALRKAGYEVVECCDGVDLFENLGAYFMPGEEYKKADLVISDIRMPGLTGLEILEGLRKRGDFPPFVLITAFGDAATHAEAEQYGALAVFDKPFDIDDLIAKVRKIMPQQEKKQKVTGAPNEEMNR